MKSSILIEGMEFYAYHGFYEEEHQIGCKYSVNLELDVDFLQAAEHDDLSDTINYEIVYQLVHKEMFIQSALIENVAWRIATSLKKSFPMIETVHVTLYKYNPALGGKLDRVAVKIAL